MSKTNTVRKQQKKEKSKVQRGMSYKDFSILFLTEGLGKCEDALASNKVGAGSAVQACDHLQARGIDVQLLSALVKRFAPTVVSSGIRGRQAPADGETRKYSVQVVVGGGPFIKMPIPHGRKGQKVAVTFGATAITIQR